MHNKSWFEVDKDGLRTLQLGKPKWYAIRELSQNAFDEKISICRITATHERGLATISVEDDAPEGFRDLKDAYTLFKDCYKRPDPTKRGRYNIGEKQSFAICECAIVETTKGTVVFDKKGRHHQRTKRDMGTKVTVQIRMNRDEFAEILTYVRMCIPPDGIDFSLNGEKLYSPEPTTVFETKLTTEILSGDRMTKTVRNTAVTLYKREGDEKTYLYEMGIPICVIDCEYSIDVDQRVPMGVDRDTVSESYLQDLYAELLNHTHEEITAEQSSERWVRTAMSDDRIRIETTNEVVKKRYGDKVCVATPNDPVSVDDAISHGYNVVHGPELSGDEWDNVRKANAIQSSHELFGHGTAKDIQPVVETESMKKVRLFTELVAKRFLGIDVSVKFVKSKQMCPAQWDDGLITINVTKVDVNNPLSTGTVNTIIHELGHAKGHHTQDDYHQALTYLGANLMVLALKEPAWFEQFEVVQ